MGVLLLTETEPFCCAIREIVPSNGKGHVFRFKPMSSNQAYGIVFTETRSFKVLPLVSRRPKIVVSYYGKCLEGRKPSCQRPNAEFISIFVDALLRSIESDLGFRDTGQLSIHDPMDIAVLNDHEVIAFRSKHERHGESFKHNN